MDMLLRVSFSLPPYQILDTTTVENSPQFASIILDLYQVI